MVAKVNTEFKEAFAKRFRDACNDNPRIPPLNRGLYGYIATRMSERGIPTTNQAVQKWYYGAAVPGRDRMTILADVIGSDPDYLLIGTTADETKRPTPIRVIERNGAVNLIIGVLEMMGVHCAVVEDDEPGDIFAMREGKVTRLLARGVLDAQHPVSFTIPKDHYRSKLVVLTVDKAGRATFFHIPSDVVEQYGEKGNGFFALEVEFSENAVRLGEATVSKIDNPLDVLN